jgi:hypothetical protein
MEGIATLMSSLLRVPPPQPLSFSPPPPPTILALRFELMNKVIEETSN